MEENIKKDRGIKTIVCAQIFLICAVFEFLVYAGFTNLQRAGSLVMAVSFSLIFPIYLLTIERDYLVNKKIKLHFGKSLKFIIRTLLMELVITMAFSIIINFINPLETNLNVKFMEQGDKIDVIIILVVLLWNLMGEEGAKLAFFLFADRYFKFIKIKENSRYYLLWAIDCIFFGIMHLSAYNNNIFQCIFVIGVPSIVYGYLWKKTQNPLIMWLTHVIYDYSLIALALF